MEPWMRPLLLSPLGGVGDSSSSLRPSHYVTSDDCGLASELGVLKTLTPRP